MAISVAKAQKLQENPQKLEEKVEVNNINMSVEGTNAINEIIQLFPESWNEIEKSINNLIKLIRQSGGAVFLNQPNEENISQPVSDAVAVAVAAVTSKNNIDITKFIKHIEDITNITSILQQIYNLFQVIDSQHVGYRSLENSLLFALYFTTQKTYIYECEKIKNEELKKAFIENIKKMYKSFREEYGEAFNQYKEAGQYHSEAIKRMFQLKQFKTGIMTQDDLVEIINNYNQEVLSKLIAISVVKINEEKEEVPSNSIEEISKKIAVALVKSNDSSHVKNRTRPPPPLPPLYKKSQKEIQLIKSIVVAASHARTVTETGSEIETGTEIGTELNNGNINCIDYYINQINARLARIYNYIRSKKIPLSIPISSLSANFKNIIKNIRSIIIGSIRGIYPKIKPLINSAYKKIDNIRSAITFKKNIDFKNFLDKNLRYLKKLLNKLKNDNTPIITQSCKNNLHVFPYDLHEIYDKFKKILQDHEVMELPFNDKYSKLNKLERNRLNLLYKLIETYETTTNQAENNKMNELITLIKSLINNKSSSHDKIKELIEEALNIHNEFDSLINNTKSEIEDTNKSFMYVIYFLHNATMY